HGRKCPGQQKDCHGGGVWRGKTCGLTFPRAFPEPDPRRGKDRTRAPKNPPAPALPANVAKPPFRNFHRRLQWSIEPYFNLPSLFLNDGTAERLERLEPLTTIVSMVPTFQLFQP